MGVNKLKKWIKNKLRKYLGIEEVEEQINVLASDIEKGDRKISDAINQSNMAISVSRKLQKTSESLINQFNISADIYPHEKSSWAVISIQGRPEYVKFVNLSNRDMREISSFLRQFEGTNRTIDSPFWRDLFK